MIIFNSNVFGCGCVNAYTASVGANTIIANYRALDIINNSLFTKQLTQLKKELKYETENRINSDHEVIFSVDSVVNLKLLNFSIDKQKKIKVVP